MVRADKREQKIRQNPKNVSLKEFEWLIRKYGRLESGGRHAVAFIGREAYPYPRSNPVRQPYVKGLLELIDKEGK